MGASPDSSNPDPRGARSWIWALLLLTALAWGVRALRHPHRPETTTALPVVARTNLMLLAGRWFQLPETNAFTGCMVESYPDGSPRSRAAVSNGLLHGLSVGYYTNGQVQIRECYKDSIADGLRQRFYASGQKKSEAFIVNGKLEGTFRSWHENGQLAEQIEMNQGNPDGEAWAFYPSGFVKAESRVRAGQVLDQKCWEDGQRQQASTAPNGPPDGTQNETGNGGH